MLESLHFQVPPSFSLPVGVSTQGNFLPLLAECDFDLGMTTLLILMSQLQCLQWFTKCALLAGCSPVAQGAFRMTCEVRNPGSGGGK